MKIIQARDIEKALDGFTRAVQLDPENGEAWNNIACLYVSPAYIPRWKMRKTLVSFAVSTSISADEHRYMNEIATFLSFFVIYINFCHIIGGSS